MKYLVMVDFPTLAEMASNPYKELKFVQMCDTLNKLRPSEVAIHEGMENRLFAAFASRWNVLSGFLKIGKVVVYSGMDIDGLTSNPDVIGSIDEEDMKSMEQNSLSLLHKKAQQGVPTLFFIASDRWKLDDTKVLLTISNRESQNHCCWLCDDQEQMSNVVAQHIPVLEQHKHGKEAYILNNKLVSPFSTYYKVSKEAAEKLLETAYYESEQIEQELFPHYLYTWDSNERTFVEFRRNGPDGTQQYHGLDLPKSEWDKVPNNIRNKYHQ